MELKKSDEKALEFKHGDVTFLVKPKATAMDRLQVVMAHTPEDMLTRAIKQMVIGWQGVTDGGKDAPYTYESLSSIPEPIPNDSVMMKLGYFVMEKTDVIGSKEVEPKNG